MMESYYFYHKKIMITLIHNSNCSKSNKALQILEANHIDFSIRNYIQDPLSYDELSHLLSLLQCDIWEIVRTSEVVWKEKYSAYTWDNDQLLHLLAQEPQLLQRPIIVTQDKAVIARTEDKINSILNL